MNIKIIKNADDIGKVAAMLFAAEVNSKPNCVLGLATGSTPIPTYKALQKMYKRGLVDFSNVTTFNLDEYIGLDHEHNQSYYYFMKKNLFDGINVPEENINVPCGISDNIEETALEYDKMIEQAGGIDIQILGIGQNSHIAFNEPCDNFPMHTHKVSLTENTIEANSRFFKSKNDVPKFAITMGIGTIMKAKKIVIIATGESKADAVYSLVKGNVRPQIPASVLQLHNNVTLICDESAACKL